MSRPKSMSDFQSLFDASYPPLATIPERERPRKRASISLATGLKMLSSETQSPKSMEPVSRATNGVNGVSENASYSDSLFYAYAQRVRALSLSLHHLIYPKQKDYAQTLPYIICFSSASVANQWWTMVEKEYPGSERPGPQLFLLKGHDMPSEIQDNIRFHSFRNKWFLMNDGTEGSTSVIPIQDAKGWPVALSTPQPPPPVATTAAPTASENPTSPSLSNLQSTLTQTSTLLNETTTQIHALSTAQTSGLSHMQDIAETNSSQIKSLTTSLQTLQSLVAQNTTQHLALTNASFTAQEQLKTSMQENALQIKALADAQREIVGMFRKVAEGVQSGGSGTAGAMGVQQRAWDEGSIGKGQVGQVLSPPPRKLNRRVKSVWYEYDGVVTPAGTPRRGTMGLLQREVATPTPSLDKRRKAA
ncbi:hypothetical protein M011DRAFT_466679 [Sporormia fimetaria CBS 119925]|uniref:Uncharacterized protein n=1 Tax=Sporormia fimetaria CBS 119925 TaxID=1340428 RepID=A0A6A6VEN1_9PLEO|nr:hypothetical protein M011DRAFT_466679 [Sporormia fimetaria CBS 119925]